MYFSKYIQKGIDNEEQMGCKMVSFSLLGILSPWQNERHIKRTAGGKCILLLAVFDLSIEKDYWINTHLWFFSPLWRRGSVLYPQMLLYVHANVVFGIFLIEIFKYSKLIFVQRIFNELYNCYFIVLISF